MSNRQRILFVCTGNSCRSQMAEAWARALLREYVEPYSAGVAVSELDPHAVQVMQETGIDITAQPSKSIVSLPAVPFDCVVTLSDRAQAQAAAYWHPDRLLHAGLPAPKRLPPQTPTDDGLAQYRQIRDEIRCIVERLGISRTLSLESAERIQLRQGTAA